MHNWIIGIDEVGRGPLAGPVLVCAAAMPETYDVKKEGKKAGLCPLKDSKQLSAKDRQKWADWIKKNKNIAFSFSFATPASVDKMNIGNVANYCAWRAFNSVLKKINSSNVEIFLDGGLYLKNKKFQKDFTAYTAPKSDENNPIVAVVSILAKVKRDAYMGRLDKKYPGYGFSQNMGYGTRSHMEVLRKNGPSPAHRLTFLWGICKIRWSKTKEK